MDRMSLMLVMRTPCQGSESLKATHKSSILQRERSEGQQRPVGKEMAMKESESENACCMLRDGEDSFPLLSFSPQCGHLYRVRLIIPYPQTWQAISVTLKACGCMCEFQTCVCVCVPFVWLCF